MTKSRRVNENMDYILLVAGRPVVAVDSRVLVPPAVVDAPTSAAVCVLVLVAGPAGAANSFPRSASPPAGLRCRIVLRPRSKHHVLIIWKFCSTCYNISTKLSRYYHCHRQAVKDKKAEPTQGLHAKVPSSSDPEIAQFAPPTRKH